LYQMKITAVKTTRTVHAILPGRCAFCR
jgi:hypothetical protein